MLGGLFGFDMPEPDYRALWMDYSAASQRLARDYESDLATRRSDLLARGIEEGSEGWQASMAEAETRRSEAEQRIQGTEEYGLLSSAYESMVSMANAPMRLAEYGDDSQQQARNPYADVIYGQGAAREMERLVQPGQRFDMGQWSRKPVDMNTYYERQYGAADISQDEVAPEANPEGGAAEVRARRAAAGGVSPWW